MMYFFVLIQLNIGIDLHVMSTVVHRSNLKIHPEFLKKGFWVKQLVEINLEDSAGFM